MTKIISSIMSRVAFLRWAAALFLPEIAIVLIERIRSLGPSRRVGGRFSVRGAYASTKMGQTIQFEARSTEMRAIISLEHEPSIREYYDQPFAIKLCYKDKSGRNLGLLHTPDFFVIPAAALPYWMECKSESKLLELAIEMPNRYVRQSDGSWRCPPGQAFAAKYSLGYQVHSTRDIADELTRNLTFLADYQKAKCPKPDSAVIAKVKEAVRKAQGITYLELRGAVRGLTVDDLNYLIARNEIYTDLRCALLVNPQTVALYSDINAAIAVAASKRAVGPSVIDDAGPVQIIPTAKIRIGDVEHIITGVDENVVHLMSMADGKFSHQKRADLEGLVHTGQVTAVGAVDARQKKVHDALVQAGPVEQMIAVGRWHAIQPFLRTGAMGSRVRKSKHRSIRRWVARFRTYQMNVGNGFIGLLPVPRVGNRKNHLIAPEVEQLMEDFISKRFETYHGCSMTHVWGLLVKACAERGLVGPSFKTFSTHVRARPQYGQLKKTKGPRSAYQKKAFVYFLDITTPQHGDRPWEIAHIDHTELDIELVCSRTGKNLGRPWLTIMIDAYTRRFLAITISFSPESSESNARVIRECVQRHHRLPANIVVDNGKPFDAINFDCMLAAYEITKISRPPHAGRAGCVCERMFGTNNTRFVHNLLGNTKLTKNVRQVSASVNPKNLAVWTLEDFAPIQRQFCYEVYDTTPHPALGLSPCEAEARFMEATGKREHMRIAYDTAFEILTLPTTKSGFAKVHPQKGVRIKYLDYWCAAFSEPNVAGETVPVRFNPWDASIAYAYVSRKWQPCISTYANVFKNWSKRAIEAATDELRKRKKQHAHQRSSSGGQSGRPVSISILQLAKFMEEVSAREDMLIIQAQESANRLANQSTVPSSPTDLSPLVVKPASVPMLPTSNNNVTLPTPSPTDQSDDTSTFPTSEE